MNRSERVIYTDPYIASSNWWVRDAYRISAMLSMSKEYCSPPDIRNVSDDRIHPQLHRGRIARVESTVDGDVVIIDPSFADSSYDAGNSSHSSCREQSGQARESQARSPQQDRKTVKDTEERNPCSPGDQLETSSHNRRHTRNLSTLFDATSIGRNNSIDSGEIYIDDEFLLSGLDRKHKRDMSNGFVGHSSVHRRLNSIGTSQNVHRRPGHQREDSLGLDILSAAVEASQDELAQAAGEQVIPRRPNLEPRPTNQNAYHRRPHSSHPPSHQPSHTLVPPYGRHYVVPQAHGNYVPTVHNGYTHTSYLSNVVPSYYAPNFIPRQGQGYPMQHYPTQHLMHPPPPAPPKNNMYPPEKRSYPQDFSEVRPSTKSPEWPRSTNLQTFSSIEKNQSTHPTKEEASNTPSKSHHRHLSSLGSVGLGNILSASILSPGAEQDVLPSTSETKPHHRSTSSVSFLNSLDVCGLVGSADETFLRNLQEASNNAYQSPTPMDGMGENAPMTNDGSYPGATVPTRSPNKLATGGTSKRIRRKCTVGGCINRVVQGGLCIAHGAKRKLCGHPGCTKNVKKAGLCSTHGPARKRCDLPGCSKVAVQGGRCIAHGAKKKLCEVSGCDKQAILTGMCKKHHDEHKSNSKTRSDNSGGGGSDESVTSKKSCSMHKSNHTRGLSIFHEIPANEIESIINADTLRADPSLPATEPPRSGVTDNFW